ncbi:MAG TPA: class I SAM-dependent methyltransferase [Anaerolineae bacterium]
MTSAIDRIYLWACECLYNEFAWSYDAVSWLVSGGRWQSWRELVLDELPPGRVLELGFGTGELLLALAAQGRTVYGLEQSRAMQRIARRKLQTRGLSAQVRRFQGIAQRLPFADGSFAAVVATFPAGYIFDAIAAGEIARVLQPPEAGASAGRLVVGGVAITLDNPRLARAMPVFYGEPAAPALARWQATLVEAGLRPRLISRPAGGVHVLMLVAEKAA